MHPDAHIDEKQERLREKLRDELGPVICDTAWQTAIRGLRSRLKPPKLASVPQRMSRGVFSPIRRETDSTLAKCTCRPLIPAGSTLVGIYNSHVGYGQKALQAVWRRVIFPDGSSLSLGGFEGDIVKERQDSETRWTTTGAGSFREPCLRPSFLLESRLAKGKIPLFSLSPATDSR